MPEKNETIVFSSFLSFLIHLVLVVGMSFTFPLSDPALSMELLLAQNKARKEPLKVEYKAPVAQESSGESADNVRPRVLYTPLLISLEFLPQSQLIFSAAGEGQEPALLLAKKDKRDDVLSFSRRKISKSGSQGADSNSRLLSTSRERLQAEIMNLEASLGALEEQQAKRPRIKRYTSIAAQSAVEAEYIYRWVTKIETIGNINYPRSVATKGIDGSLRLLVALDAQGRVISLRLLRSSGYKLLDDSARYIVRLAEPFEEFPPDLQKQADIIEIVRTWHFYSDRQRVTFE